MSAGLGSEAMMFIQEVFEWSKLSVPRQILMLTIDPDE